MSKKVITLDVREEIKQGREPFSKIMQAVSGLSEKQDLLLIAPFEPAPLFAVLGRQGFAHRSTERPDGDWEVLFTRNAEGIEEPGKSAAEPAPSKNSPRKCPGPSIVDVDARDLEPPGPLVKILEALSNLPEGAHLRAFTDRRPMHLYSHLQERGFVGESEEQQDGSFVTHVRRS